MQEATPYEYNPSSFGIFVVETRNQTSRPSPRGVDEAKMIPKTTIKINLS
jgi:hypothetical protein